MNKNEYLKELDRLLQTIPETERVEALTYYEEYFNDAGEENEQAVMDELGYPAKIAENIKEGLRGNMDFREITDRPNQGTGTGYQNASKGFQNNGTGYQNAGYQSVGTQNIYTSQPGNKGQGNASESGKLPTWAIVLIVIGCIILSPALLGGAGAVVGVLFGAIASIIAAVIGFGATGIGLIVGAVACLVVGFACVFATPFVGLTLIGAGLFMAAIAILFLMFTVWLCGWAIPTLIKWIIKQCRKLFHKNSAQNA